MTLEQQDVIKAQNRSTKKCEFYNKTGHTESQCRSLKNAISELKKDNSKKIVEHTTSAPASEEVDEGDAYEAVYVHTTETSSIISTTLCAKTWYFVITVHLPRFSETRTS